MNKSEQDLEQAVREFQEMMGQANAEIEKGLRDGTLQQELKIYAAKQERARKVRLWGGYISLTLAILGVVFLITALFPFTLLKVGIIAAWLAIGLLTTR